MTVADLLAKLGGIPPQRVRLEPPPGKAREKDVLAVERREGRLCELVEGTLVEKPMGYEESSLAIWIGHLLHLFLDEQDLGILAGESGALRLMPGLVRIPDLSFISWDQMPNRELPNKSIPNMYPDLAVEVLSPSNTKGEMDRKVREYFLSGSRLVWLIDPRKRTVRAYTAPDEWQVLKDDQNLDGGDVLPGLRLPLREVFGHLDRISTRKKRT
jgi:Uma2 family endonuclease